MEQINEFELKYKCYKFIEINANEFCSDYAMYTYTNNEQAGGQLCPKHRIRSKMRQNFECI